MSASVGADEAQCLKAGLARIAINIEDELVTLAVVEIVDDVPRRGPLAALGRAGEREPVGACAAGQLVAAEIAEQEVGADTAGDHVVAAVTEEGVVAGAAGHPIGADVTDERIVLRRAGDVLEPRDRIAVGVAAEDRALGSSGAESPFQPSLSTPDQTV